MKRHLDTPDATDFFRQWHPVHICGLGAIINEINAWCLEEFGQAACDYYLSYHPEHGVSLAAGIIRVTVDDSAVWESTSNRIEGMYYFFKNENDAIMFKLRWG